MIRGKRVDQVTEILDFTPKHVAKIIGKVVKSAVANAVAMEGKINVEHMHVKMAVAQAGPTMKRFLPRAQGRATPLLKRTCHILIIVEGDAPTEDATPSRRQRRAPAKAAVPAEATAPAAAKAKPSARAAHPAAKKKVAAKSKSKEA